jgi:WD40 repeat protein
LASGSTDGFVKLWDARTGQLLRTSGEGKSPITSLAYGRNGRLLAAGSGDNQVSVWDTRTWLLTFALADHAEAATSVAFDPTGERIASGSADKVVRLWDSRTGALLFRLAGHTAPITDVAFSPDGQVLYSHGGKGDESVRTWDVGTGAAAKTLVPSSSSPWSIGSDAMAVSPDGQRLLIVKSIGYGHVLRDAHTGDILKRLAGAVPAVASPVASVAFHPDGQSFAFANDSSVRICDEGSLGQERVLNGHTLPIQCAWLSVRTVNAWLPEALTRRSNSGR